MTPDHDLTVNTWHASLLYVSFQAATQEMQASHQRVVTRHIPDMLGSLNTDMLHMSRVSLAYHVSL